MSTGTPFDAFLAGATRFEWCCLDCPRLYVTHGGALRHSITKRHDYADREHLAGFGTSADEVHPFAAGVWPDSRASGIICCYCSLSREWHDQMQEALRPRLLAELRWTLRALRKQKALVQTTGLYGLPLVDTVSSGMAYLPP